MSQRGHRQRRCSQVTRCYRARAHERNVSLGKIRSAKLIGSMDVAGARTKHSRSPSRAVAPGANGTAVFCATSAERAIRGRLSPQSRAKLAKRGGDGAEVFGAKRADGFATVRATAPKQVTVQRREQAPNTVKQLFKKLNSRRNEGPSSADAHCSVPGECDLSAPSQPEPVAVADMSNAPSFPSSLERVLDELCYQTAPDATLERGQKRCRSPCPAALADDAASRAKAHAPASVRCFDTIEPDRCDVSVPVARDAAENLAAVVPPEPCTTARRDANATLSAAAERATTPNSAAEGAMTP